MKISNWTIPTEYGDSSSPVGIIINNQFVLCGLRKSYGGCENPVGYIEEINNAMYYLSTQHNSPIREVSFYSFEGWPTISCSAFE